MSLNQIELDEAKIWLDKNSANEWHTLLMKLYDLAVLGNNIELMREFGSPVMCPQCKDNKPCTIITGEPGKIARWPKDKK